MQYDTAVIVNVRGGKTLKLPIVADAELPQCVVAEDEFDFGGALFVCFLYV